MTEQYPNQPDEERNNGAEDSTQSDANLNYDANSVNHEAEGAAQAPSQAAGAQPTGAEEPTYPTQENSPYHQYSQYGQSYSAEGSQYAADGQQQTAENQQYAAENQQYAAENQQYAGGAQYAQYSQGNQYSQNPYVDPSYQGQQDAQNQNPYVDPNAGQYQQYQQQYSQYHYQQYPAIPAGYIPRNKYVAAALGIFFGCLGLHNFYLGNTGKGVAQILVTVLGAILIVGPIASMIWGLVEGMLILCSDRGSHWHQDAKGVELEH